MNGASKIAVVTEGALLKRIYRKRASEVVRRCRELGVLGHGERGQ